MSYCDVAKNSIKKGKISIIKSVQLFTVNIRNRWNQRMNYSLVISF